MKNILLLFIFIPNIAYAQYFEPFSNQDIILQSIYTAVTVIDWMQTKDFVSKGVEELNPILGKTPSQSRIDKLIFGAIVTHGLISYTIPQKYRFYWQSLFTMIEFGTICMNYKKSVENNRELFAYLRPTCDDYTIRIDIEF